MKTKFLKKLLAALLLALLAALPAFAEKRFHILMINDPHSYILPYREAVTEADGRQSVAYTGGMARALELVRAERAKIEAESGAPVFLFEAGDVMLGLKGALTAGEAEYGALALLGFDAGVLGNHDFDGGVKTLAKLGPKLKFPVLASNIEFEDERAVGRYFAKSTIIERGGVKLGVFGLVTPELKSVVSFPEGFGVDAELAAVAERYVRELRAAGADAVVAINHIGLPLDKKLAAEARGIDVIVGGHTHDAVEEKIIIDNGANSTLVGQAGLDGRYAGRFDVTVDEGGLVAEKVVVDAAVRDARDARRAGGRGYGPRGAARNRGGAENQQPDHGADARRGLHADGGAHARERVRQSRGGGFQIFREREDRLHQRRLAAHRPRRPARPVLVHGHARPHPIRRQAPPPADDRRADTRAA